MNGSLPVVTAHDDNRPSTIVIEASLSSSDGFEMQRWSPAINEAQNQNEIGNEVPHSVLATACLRVKNGRNTFTELRVLCDTGAQVNLMSDTAFRQLQFARQPSRMSIVGVGGAVVVTMGKVAIEMWHRVRDVLIATSAFTIVDGVHMNHPQRSFQRLALPHIADADLADPTYNERGPIDGIIGVNILSQHFGTQLQRAPCRLLTQDTSFGWIVYGGRAPDDSGEVLGTVGIVTMSELHTLIRKLWEQDELHDRQAMSTEEIECETLYKSTIVRNEHRYSVTLLLKPNAQLGESRLMARRRLFGLERRFEQHPDLRKKYIAFMQEYAELGHMRKADPLDQSKMHYYIPHHAVSIDRKFRVVFDASARTTNGSSLNDVQYVGPRLQRDLFDILMSFRIGRIAMSADVAKMFRQIEVQRPYWDLQRILWRESPQEPIQEWWLTVVTYGLASSPYNAVRTLTQCAIDNAEKLPHAAAVVQEDFYVDDLLTSLETELEAKQLKSELTALLQSGGFELTKWCSNYDVIMNEQIDSKLVTEQDSTSVLGLVWNFRTDELQFRVQQRTQPEIITKRLVTSEAAKIFDPQGYVAPVTIRAKLSIQETWRDHKTWDEPLPAEFTAEWKAFCIDVQLIEKIRIPRWIGTSLAARSQIHVFCDASTKAYGAAAYIRTCVDGVWSATLLCSKAKVAPIKIVTVPRLELCAIELGSKLTQKIRLIEALKDAPVFLWTDSEIVLHWLRKSYNELKTYVASRVSRILQVIKVDDSYHVRTNENPADLLSRGVYTQALIDSDLWWHGPAMLRQRYEAPPPWHPKIPDAVTGEIVGSEMKRPAVHFEGVMLTTMVDSDSEIDLIERWSSYTKACRITALVLRFCHILHGKLKRSRTPTSHWLSAYDAREWRSEAHTVIRIEETEINFRLPSIRENRIALNYWSSMSQRQWYPNELDAVRKGRVVERGSALWTLTPQIGDDGLMRICGRLGNSNLPYEVKHPIILSRKSTLSRLMSEEAHRLLCHGGVQSCTQFLRHRFWIVGVRILLRTVVNKCIICTRFRQQSERQFMADLPALRTQPAPAFEYTGVDYAGPIILKYTRNTTTKGWIAVFVCMRYRTVHLELVSGLDTASFLAALQRFVNLRAGCVQHMHSDNGTNFIGAARELREAAAAWQDQDVSQYLSTQGIEWHNTTPFAPHQGGIWERMVQQVKLHLKKMSGAQLFTFEEMATLLSQISACINSRPLTPISSDPSDLTALTPGHFISSRPIVSPLEKPLTDVPTSRLSAWQRITKLQQEFANRWMQECFSEQQRRNKWAGIYRSMRVGDMVLIKSDIVPACRWPMGRVIEVFSGPDGRIRSCRLRTGTSEVNRPVTKLCLLPVDSDIDKTSETGFCPQ